MSEDVQRMKEAAERARQQQLREQQAQAQRQAEAARASREAAEKSQTQKEFETQKTSKILEQQGRALESEARRIESEAKFTKYAIDYQAKTPEPEPIYKVGGSGPQFKKTIETLQKASDRFYEGSGLPDRDKLIELAVIKPGSRLGPSPYKVKNTEEALNRLGWAATEMTIGVAVEEGFPFSIGELPPPSKGTDTGLRVLGGLLAPSPADLVAGQIIARLAKTKTWQKLIGKYGEVDVSELEKQAAREIEKLKGKGQAYSVAEIRKGVNKVYNNLEDIAEFYRKHPELATPERSSAGAAQVPKVVQEFEDFLDDLGWNMDEYLKFMRSRAPELPVGALVNILAGISDRGEPIEETIIDLSSYTDRADKYKFTPEEKAALAEAAEALQDQAQEPIQDTPERAVQDTPQRQEQVTPQKAEQVTPQRVLEKKPLRDEEGRFIKPRTLPTGRGPDTMRFYQGKKQRYKVEFTYPRGGKETVTVEARSYPEAMQIAQRARTPRRDIPSEVNLWVLS